MVKAEKNIAAPGDFEQLTEEERLKRDMYRPDVEKLHLLTKMFRMNAILKKAVIRHK